MVSPGLTKWKSNVIKVTMRMPKNMNKVIPTLQTATPEQQDQAKSAGLDLIGCDGRTGVWFKACCGKFLCMEGATPYGSNACEEARRLDHCRLFMETHG
jgi:hypothetical protein